MRCWRGRPSYAAMVSELRMGRVWLVLLTACIPGLCTGKQVKENPGFLQLRKIDAAIKVANTISSSANRVFLDSNALLLNVNDITLKYVVHGWECVQGRSHCSMSNWHRWMTPISSDYLDNGLTGLKSFFAVRTRTRPCIHRPRLRSKCGCVNWTCVHWRTYAGSPVR